MPRKFQPINTPPPQAKNFPAVTFSPLAQVLTFGNRDERLENAQSALEHARDHLRALFAERSKWVSDAQLELLPKLKWLERQIDAKRLMVEKAFEAFQMQQSARVPLGADDLVDAQVVFQHYEKLGDKQNSYELLHRFHMSLCQKYALMNQEYDQLSYTASNAYRERIDAAYGKVAKYCNRVHSIERELADLPDELSTCATQFGADADEADVVLVSMALSGKGCCDDGTGSPLVTWVDSVPELDAEDWNFVLSGDEDRWAPPSFLPVPEMDCAQLLAGDMGYFGAMH